MKIFRNSRNSGFTTAELMIALLIMGVIVASVVPVVITKVQDEQYKVAWKKAYADFAQATDKIMADNAGSLKGVFTNATVLKNKYAQYIGCVKQCDLQAQSQSCWHQVGQFYLANGTADPYTYSDRSGCIMKNGMLAMFTSFASNCTFTTYSGTVQTCGDIYVDVNGFKKPNTYGKDIFEMWITENSIKPYGVQGDGRETDCGATVIEGGGCSAQYLYQ